MNNGFIESRIVTPVVLPSNSSMIAFQNDTRSRSTMGCNGWLCHKEGSPVYKIVKSGNYKGSLNVTLYSATAGTAALGLYEDGVLIPDSVTAVTLSAGYLGNVSFNKIIKVCCKANTSLSVGSVPTIVNPATGDAVTTVAPTISAGTFNIID